MKLWIARNEDGTLALFKTKPMSLYNEGNASYWAGSTLYLSRYDFPEVTYENSPQEVELKLVK